MEARDLVDPPRHIAVISKVPSFAGADLAFLAAALAIQVRDHVCKAWGLLPIEVAAYLDGADLPPSTAAVLYLVENDGNPASLGYHASIGGLVYGFVDVKQTRAEGGRLSVVASHEIIEMILNKLLDRWVWESRLGLFLWREACDPVQDLSYPIAVEIMGQKRLVFAADFLLPNYFDSTSRTWGDFLGRVSPLQISADGYQVAKDRSGRIVSLPQGSPTAAAHVAKKLSRELSRLTRLGLAA